MAFKQIAVFMASALLLAGCGASMELKSDAIADGKTIPQEYTGDGADRSPSLVWAKAPAATRELALICDDPDATGGEPWVHWVIYKIPASAKSLPAGLPTVAELHDPAGALQGCNSWGADSLGYRGPAPPKKSGPHHYRFHMYAIDAPVDLAAGATKTSLLKAMQGHVLAEGVLTGLYER